MSIEGVAKILGALTEFLDVILWPALILFVIVRFGPGLRNLVSELREFSLKGPGFEASAKLKRAEAAAALAAAGTAKFDTGATPEVRVRENRAAAALVSEAVRDQTIRKAASSTILWVDDRPRNNILERQALEALGITFVISETTEDAFNRLNRSKFDLIISDMGRPPDDRAGYTLLEELRQSGDRTPFLIYAGSRAPEHVAEAKRRGAFGCTNRPDELFQMVVNALERDFE